jgi:hypothetical protein
VKDEVVADSEPVTEELVKETKPVEKAKPSKEMKPVVEQTQIVEHIKPVAVEEVKAAEDFKFTERTKPTAEEVKLIEDCEPLVEEKPIKETESIVESKPAEEATSIKESKPAPKKYGPRLPKGFFHAFTSSSTTSRKYTITTAKRLAFPSPTSNTSTTTKPKLTDLFACSRLKRGFFHRLSSARKHRIAFRCYTQRAARQDD